MPQLTMISDDGEELLRVTIRNVEPSVATVAILKALDAIPQPRKTRADAGVQRGPRKVTEAIQQPAVTTQ